MHVPFNNVFEVRVQYSVHDLCGSGASGLGAVDKTFTPPAESCRSLVLLSSCFVSTKIHYVFYLATVKYISW